MSAMSTFISSRLPAQPAGQVTPGAGTDTEALSSTWGSDLSGSLSYSSDSDSFVGDSRQYKQPQLRRQPMAGGRAGDAAALLITAAACRSPGGAVARLMQGDALPLDCVTPVPHVRCVLDNPDTAHRLQMCFSWHSAEVAGHAGQGIGRRLRAHGLCCWNLHWPLPEAEHVACLPPLLQVGHIRGPCHCLHRRWGAASAARCIPGAGKTTIQSPLHKDARLRFWTALPTRSSFPLTDA